jgi:hypothetical protein
VVQVQILPQVFTALTQIPVVGDVLRMLFPMVNGTPTLTLQQGQDVKLPLPDPLASEIIASSGSTTTTKDGASAAAASLELKLFTGLPGGGIDLAVSDANAAVSGGAAVKVSATRPAPKPAAPPGAPAAPAQQLAYTGDNPWRPVIGAFLLVVAVGGFEVIRRSRRHRHADT